MDILFLQRHYRCSKDLGKSDQRLKSKGVSAFWVFVCIMCSLAFVYVFFWSRIVSLLTSVTVNYLLVADVSPCGHRW